MSKVVRVVAGIICRKTSSGNEILVTRRKPGGPAGGLWEFPGGKVRPCESDEEALIREIKEELGIDIETGSHFSTTRHSYPEKTIDLVCYLARRSGGKIELRDHDEFAWIGPADLTRFDFAPADMAAVHMLKNRVEIID